MAVLPVPLLQMVLLSGPVSTRLPLARMHSLLLPACAAPVTFHSVREVMASENCSAPLGSSDRRKRLSAETSWLLALAALLMQLLALMSLRSSSCAYCAQLPAAAGVKSTRRGTCAEPPSAALPALSPIICMGGVGGLGGGGLGGVGGRGEGGLGGGGERPLGTGGGEGGGGRGGGGGGE